MKLWAGVEQKEVYSATIERDRVSNQGGYPLSTEQVVTLEVVSYDTTPYTFNQSK